MKKKLIYVGIGLLSLIAMSSCGSASGDSIVAEKTDSLITFRAKSLNSPIIVPAKVWKSNNVYKSGDTVWVSRSSRIVLDVSWNPEVITSDSTFEVVILQ